MRRHACTRAKSTVQRGSHLRFCAIPPIDENAEWRPFASREEVLLYRRHAPLERQHVFHGVLLHALAKVHVLLLARQQEFDQEGDDEEAEVGAARQTAKDEWNEDDGHEVRSFLQIWCRFYT